MLTYADVYEFWRKVGRAVLVSATPGVREIQLASAPVHQAGGGIEMGASEEEGTYIHIISEVHFQRPTLVQVTCQSLSLTHSLSLSLSPSLPPSLSLSLSLSPSLSLSLSLACSLSLSLSFAGVEGGGGGGEGVIEMVVRPTHVLDPEIEIFPRKGQLAKVLEEEENVCWRMLTYADVC
jgi:hypothetical protein